MKSLVIAVLAAALSLGTMTSGAAFADPGQGRGQGRGHGPEWREGRHDNGLHRGWDRQRYNGYSYRGIWHYGPPPSSIAEIVEFGYRVWRNGDRLPDYYRNSFEEVDYRDHHFDAPPRGYHYVRDDRGDYLLVGIATGVILGVILANQ